MFSAVVVSEELQRACMCDTTERGLARIAPVMRDTGGRRSEVLTNRNLRALIEMLHNLS